MNRKLSKEELKELVGGIFMDESRSDIINDNSHWGCRCTFNNNSTISNKNSVQNCQCDCI